MHVDADFAPHWRIIIEELSGSGVSITSRFVQIGHMTYVLCRIGLYHPSVVEVCRNTKDDRWVQVSRLSH